MPLVSVNGIKLNYEEYGSGPPVILITGTATPGRVWRPYQVPALTGAGYRVITIDNRGVPPSDIPARATVLGEMAADTAALIESLRVQPCRIVGFSLGAMITQELLVGWPGLARQAVLMATRGRTDALSAALSQAECALLGAGVTLPAGYAAVVRAMQSLSPRTLRDESRARDWLDVFEMSAPDPASVKAQLGTELIPDRLDSYRRIRTPCLVLGFGDDLITPPALCLEVAQSIPGCAHRVLPGCGHLGYLEEPSQVNSLIIDFFRGAAEHGPDAPARNGLV
jgi:pimeloyl-ACP methyl ester carboxylesterase